jgi:hypothetical protein
MAIYPKDNWGVRLNEEDIGDIDVTGSPWLTRTAGGSQSNPKRVLCDWLVRGEMDQDYITALAGVAAADVSSQMITLPEKSSGAAHTS